jgi:hypothetical protein
MNTGGAKAVVAGVASVLTVLQVGVEVGTAKIDMEAAFCFYGRQVFGKIAVLGGPTVIAVLKIEIADNKPT